MIRLTAEEIIKELNMGLEEGRLSETGTSEQDQEEGWYTVDDLCEILNRERQAIRIRLKQLQKAGKLETSRRLKMTIDGVWRKSPVYRVASVSGVPQKK
jgi:DNA-binding transcriptional ArsR family regulator|tara:strand:+ start:737 stop:1033 length:297 start_codon:yes stop_codon:yes gene_type:complete